jgi:long-chain acyl-CoA synthetase
MSETGVHSGERFTPYPQLLGNAARVARGYASLGLGAGDRVALLLRNDIAFLEASLAAAVLGANPVPVNWHWKGDEVGYLLRDCEARALVVHADLWAGVADAVPEGVAVAVVPTPPELGGDGAAGGGPDGAARYAAWIEELEPWDQVPEAAPSSVIYTSGTTGRPKGVVREPIADEALAEESRQMIRDVLHLAPGERTIIPAPLYHTAPNVYALASVVQGMEMVLMPRFDAEEFLRLVERHRVTAVQMVPTMFVRLLALREDVRARYDVGSLRCIVHAAAPCPVEVKRAMIDWVGPIVTEYYGSTESGPVVFCDSEQWLAHPGTVGTALPGATVKVLGDDGAELAAGESGDVYMAMEAWPDFTYHGDAAKRAAMERDGMITAGDVGYLDEDGFLYLNDRRNDMVISGGVNIYPAEIEACLLGLDGVADCAVFGIPDERFGEALAAHVQLVEGVALDADAVRAHVRENLAGYKVPREVVFAGELPREDSGKIFKRRLREPYWADRRQRI